MKKEAHNVNHLDPVDEHALLEDAPLETSMKNSIFRAALGLGLFAIITAGLIALTQLVTEDKIALQIKKARSKALLEIVPLKSFDNDLLEDAFWLKATKELGLEEASEAFVASQNGQASHFILPVIAPEGYSGPIKLIVSINTSGIVNGVRVIEHKETPGLGDKIDTKKSDWILGFNGKSLDNTSSDAWHVKKDGGEFDQLTGATITPRAIVRSVYQSLRYFQAQQSTLLSKTQTKPTLKTSQGSTIQADTAVQAVLKKKGQ